MSKIVNYQTASLVLKTSDGVANAANSSITWYNVSLKSLLGSGFFEKFELFNMALVQAASAVSNAALGASLNDLTVMIKISGLNFINQTFSSTRNTESGVANAGVYTFVRSATSNQLYYSNNALTFRKQDYVNITIYYNSLDGDTLVNSNGQTYPSTTFFFQIVGVKENEYNDKNVIIKNSRDPSIKK